MIAQILFGLLSIRIYIVSRQLNVMFILRPPLFTCDYSGQ